MISWHAVALHLADHGGACALLDRDARIRLFNGGLEQMLGRQREEVEGTRWDESIAPPDSAVVVRSRLDRALSGTLRTFESEAVAADGRRFRLVLETVLVGRDDEQGVLLSVVSSHPVEDESDPRAMDEVDYEVSSSLSEFGRLLSMSIPGRPVKGDLPTDARCHRVLQGQAQPCDDCPILRPGTDAWPRTSARRSVRNRAAYEVVTAEPAGDRVRVRLRRISEDAISAIYESKVRDLADKAQLSERERAVLTYLLMGRSLADIAVILDISPRTVKFHQANVLEKIGADSRADLIRLVT